MDSLIIFILNNSENSPITKSKINSKILISINYKEFIGKRYYYSINPINIDPIKNKGDI